jgi:lipid-binding SYLF domain-containing protein
MRTLAIVLGPLVGAFLVSSPVPLAGQEAEDAIIQSATAVLRETMADPVKQISKSLIANAQGLAIVPGLIKGGFVVGVESGRGVAIVR